MKNSALKIGGILAGLAPALFLTQAAVAAESATTFLIDHDVLVWNQSTYKPDVGDTSKESSLKTTPTDVTIGIFWKDFGLYVTPGDLGAKVGLSYFVQKELELGLQFGSNSTKAEDTQNGTVDVDTKKDTIGLFGTYYLAINATSSAEFTLNYTQSKNKLTTKTTVAGGGTNSASAPNEKTSGFTLLAQYVMQVAPHFSYVPGIVYEAATTKDSTADSKIKKSSISLNIAHLRYSF